jgi:tRNA threonylcarbamoyladenosine biosynthesis protein TsaE
MVSSAHSILLPDAAATYSLGYRLAQVLPAGSVLLLDGELGSGKTTLIQGIGAGLGIDDAIVSPTFTLLCEYPEGRLPLYHFDLYRLEPADVEALHPDVYWEGVEVALGIVAIEWAERLLYKPHDYLQIRLSGHAPNGDGQPPARLVHFQAGGLFPIEQLALVFQ